MTIDSATLRRLAGLKLDPEQMAGVLEILADREEREEARKLKQRERTARHTAGKRETNAQANVNLTPDADVSLTLKKREANVSEPTPRVRAVLCLEEEKKDKEKQESKKEPCASLGLPFELASDTPAAGPPSCPPLPTGWPRDGFDQWWAVYPRRENRGRAEKAYAAAAKRHDVTFAELMEKTAEFARAPGDPQFIPHPATWLNGKAYLNEFQPQRAHGHQPQHQPARRPSGSSQMLAALAKIARGGDSEERTREMDPFAGTDDGRTIDLVAYRRGN